MHILGIFLDYMHASVHILRSLAEFMHVRSWSEFYDL